MRLHLCIKIINHRAWRLAWRMSIFLVTGSQQKPFAEMTCYSADGKLSIHLSIHKAIHNDEQPL